VSDEDEVQRILGCELASWEDQEVECKKTLGEAKEGVRALVEMCNADYARGLVLFGVAPDRSICGVEPGNKDTAQVKILRIIRDKVAPRLIPEIFVVEHGSVEVIAVAAHRPMDVPYYTCDGEVRVRMGSHSERLAIHEADRLYRERERKFWPGPWKCDTCRREQLHFMGGVCTDDGMFDSDIEDVAVRFALERGLIGEVLLEPVEVLQEQQPRRLLGVVQLAPAARLFPEHVVDVLEGLLKHGHLSSAESPARPRVRRVQRGAPSAPSWS